MKKKENLLEKNDLIIYLEHKEREKNREKILALFLTIIIATTAIYFIRSWTLQPIKEIEKRNELKRRKETEEIEKRNQIIKEQKRKRAAKLAFNEWYKKRISENCKNNDLEWNEFVKCTNQKMKLRAEHRKIYNY